MIKIVVDGFGGDNAPGEIVKGCLQALEQDSQIGIVLAGDKDKLLPLVQNHPHANRVEIIDAKEVITNDDVPTDAIRNKKNSSLVVAFETVKSAPDYAGVVSAGSTGAVLTGGFLKIGRIKGVNRPALSPLLPTLGGGEVLLLDCGANVDCKSLNLVQFAHMGAAFLTCVKGVQNPRVALLSNGTEDKKGNEFTKEVFALLKAEKLNFVGNMEARDITSGNYDVIVTDGFNGNIALKSCEGTALMMLKTIKNEIMKGGFFSKIGALLLKKAFKRVQNTMDYNKRGGAPFIGLEKPVIKAHGSAKAESVCGAIFQIKSMHESHLIDKIKEVMAVNAQTNG